MVSKSELVVFIIIKALICWYSIDTQCMRVVRAGDITSNPSCRAASWMECANLGNISFPFWGTANSSCALSPSFVLSNCSSAQAYWPSSSAVSSDVMGPPAVISLSPASSDGYPAPFSSAIHLTWNKDLLDIGPCSRPFSSQNLSLYNIPASINLTSFADSTFEFSYHNNFLLFNCTNTTAMSQLESLVLEQDGPGCVAYTGLCSQWETSCIQWTPPRLIAVVGIDSKCQQCMNASGVCVSDRPSTLNPSSNIFNHCVCGNKTLDFNTQTCSIPTPTQVQYPQYISQDCKLLSIHCITSAKIGAAVAISVVGIVTAIVCCHGRTRKGMRRALLDVSRTLICFATSCCVLKKTRRSLPACRNYVPNRSLRQCMVDVEGLTERPVEFSYNAMASATNSFSTIVGEGGFGVVFKGTLTLAQRGTPEGSDRMQIAVKVLEVRSKHIKKQFLNEVATVGRIHHVNVVRLLGFCMQEDHEMLVYEYVVNKSLDRWLFSRNESEEKERGLDWGQRYAIALGTARGLSYLHEECRHRTVHCDIKPQNILLDGEMCPKIADFGLARLMARDESQVVTLAKGTPGYMAPEFWMGGQSQLSTKFDVYSYGMVLLELISGHRNFGHNFEGSECFPMLAFEAAMRRDFESILDARLLSNDFDGVAAGQQRQCDQVRTATLVALWCIQYQPARRPHMSQVVQYLEGVAAVPEHPPHPAISPATVSSTPKCSFAGGQHYCTPISRGR